VARSDIDRIREKIRLRQYDMSAHAMEEMAEDFLTILDVDTAVLNGQVIRVEKDDPRGTKYIIVGTALDQQTPVGIVGRFASNGRYLIITVYEVTELEG
jgi:4-hydroxy-3-methylbut-2-enyl diphosphate reductase IspH